MGGRRHDAFSQRQAMDANVEKAPDDRAEHKEHRRPEVEGDGGPIFGDEDGFKHVKKNSKLQTPNSREAQNTKSQV
jgi:hypothetical protein